MIVQGDNGTILRINISDNNVPVDLTDVKSVVFRFKKTSGYVEKVASLTDLTNGKCEIVLDNVDTDTSGRFSFQVTVTFNDDSIFSSDIQILTIDSKL